MRNALVPQVTGLAMSLGSIFNGAIITEQVFGYPGIGTLLISAVHTGDYSLVLGIASVSILAVSVAVLIIDLLYPLLDPRVKVVVMFDDPARSVPLRPRVPHRRDPDRLHRAFAALSFVSPYPPQDSSSCRPTCRRLGPIGSAPTRAARTCSGSSPSRSATPCCSASRSRS